VASFCGKCGTAVARPDLAFCTHCGAPIVGGGAPSATSSTRRGGHHVSVPEWAVLCLIAAAWAAVAVWFTAPLGVALVRGQEVSPGELLIGSAILVLPPLAILAFIAARVAGHGGWRWALPLLLLVPILLVAVPAASGQSPLALIAPTPTPTPRPTPTPVPSPTPARILPGLPGLPSVPLPIPLPLPGRGEATPIPSARLTEEQARERVQEFVSQCRLLRTELRLARVTFEAPDWVVTLPLSGATWRVNDATGQVTPNERAAERQRGCR
jgi:hypothetical protein